MAEETNEMAANVSIMLQNMEVFEFEDRKSLENIVIELNNNFPEVIENTLYVDRHAIVKTLIS